MRLIHVFNWSVPNMILFNLPHPNLFSHGGIISGQWLDIVEYQDSWQGFRLVNNTQLGCGYSGK